MNTFICSRTHTFPEVPEVIKFKLAEGVTLGDHPFKSGVFANMVLHLGGLLREEVIAMTVQNGGSGDGFEVRIKPGEDFELPDFAPVGTKGHCQFYVALRVQSEDPPIPHMYDQYIQQVDAAYKKVHVD